MAFLDLAGIYPPLATPFDDHGHLATAHLAANVRRLAPTGLVGFAVLGSNGEYVLLDREEKLSAIAAVREAAGALTVIAGTGAESTREAVTLTARAAELGVDAALVITPHYYRARMDTRALVAHYTAVAECSPLPVIIYNMPASTGLDLDAATVLRLAEHPKIVGLKDSGGNMIKLAEIVARAPRGFQVLAGTAAFLLPALSIGAVGGILALANVAPRECVALFEYAGQGRLAEARALQHRLLAPNAAVTSAFGVPGLKAALDLLGYHGGAPRPPLLPLTAEQRDQVRDALAGAGLLESNAWAVASGGGA